MTVSNIPWNVSVSGALVLVKINEIISKINFCHPKTDIHGWNKYEQSEYICTMWSLTTQWNKLDLTQVGFYKYILILIKYGSFTDILPIASILALSCQWITIVDIMQTVIRPPKKVSVASDLRVASDPRVSIFNVLCFCYENCSQNCWIDWNSAMLRALNDFFTQGYERLPDLWGIS